MKKLLGMIGSLGIIASTGVTSVVSCDKPEIGPSNLPDTTISPDNIHGDPSEFNFYNDIYDLGELNLSDNHAEGDAPNEIEGIHLVTAIRGSVFEIVTGKEIEFINTHPVNTADSSGEIYDYNGIGIVESSTTKKYDASKINKVKYSYISTIDQQRYSIIFTFKITMDKQK